MTHHSRRNLSSGRILHKPHPRVNMLVVMKMEAGTGFQVTTVRRRKERRRAAWLRI